ncbi:uncharacterized protein STEHIDRAFT_167927 [Stereum hirsutum FP-91666 SS1]|uniref:uncharacterized protein n=1 Tax=Stereum hirsutum (strain FP-91666) TaxID=721885 RepID=UPI000440D715|nr:uncharacterized protein STEHIDRAFT_167927 [Stereum hirsutum FP-91666 SS1]EIM87056.1 hypothetical protein STEHIDRAFT_167927 [Stereum hirsutum FP-91666 SS1]
MSPKTATHRSSRRDARRRSLSTSSTSSITVSSDDENTFTVAIIDEKENLDPNNGKNVAVPNKSKRSKRARSSSSSTPSKKSSSPQTVKDAACRRTKRALSSRKAPSAEAIEGDMPVPVLMDATEAYTGFAYSGAHFELPPVFAVNTVHTIGDLFFDSFA